MLQKKKLHSLLLLCLLSVFIFGFGKKIIKQEADTNIDQDLVNNNQILTPNNVHKKYKVTFIELGSVNCIPCKMMQPIMDEIEEKYSNQVKIIFYDVWTAEGRKDAQKYRIKVIPTQVFLDQNGKEYYRHKGFFPKEKLIKILKMQDVE